MGVSLLAGCKGTPEEAIKAKHFPVSGEVMAKNASGQEITLRHGDIPGFMAAMTMNYSLPNPAVLEELQPGDRIAAQIAVDPANSGHYWIEDVVITAEVARKEPPALNPPHELSVGETIPDVPLVNQDDQIFHLRDYKGKAVLLTFIYTRCPMPTFCPLISSHFSRIHDALKQSPDIYKHSQMLSISLDPQYDTPPVMKKYGLAYVDGVQDDFKSWTFASTTPDDLKTLAAAFGLEYFTDGNQINHTMSTALIAKDGRVAKVWEGNDWKWQEVLEATKAAAQK
jgi:protein SCO1/2